MSGDDFTDDGLDDFADDFADDPAVELEPPKLRPDVRRKPGQRSRLDTMNINELIAKHPARAQKAKTFAARLEVLLLAGHYAAAKRLAEEAEREMDERRPDLSRCSLADLGVSVRTCAALEKFHDILHVADLQYATTQKLLATPNFNHKSIDEVWQAVLAAALTKGD